MIGKREWQEIGLVVQYVTFLAMITFLPGSDGIFILMQFVLWSLYAWGRYKLRVDGTKSLQE